MSDEPDEQPHDALDVPGAEPDGISPSVDGEIAGDGAEPIGDGTEPAGEGAEPAVDGVEPAVDGVEPAVDGVEPAVDGVEPAVDGAAAAPTTGRRTTRQQAEDRRQAKLDMVQEQVDQGGLVIRQMTDEERERYPPRPPRATRGRQR